MKRINECLLEWLRNFLTEIYQRVMIRGKVSLWSLIKAGVPAGSALRPLLFLVYLNDIVEQLNCQIE